MHSKFNFVFAFLLLHIFCFGQHVEYNFGAGTGLFHYDSDKSDKTEPFYSMLNRFINSYANDPKGEKSGFSFQFFTVIKKVTKHNLVWGIDAEFQSLQSKKELLYVFSDTMYNANGQCKLISKYLDLFPYVGKRIIIKKMYLDIMGGFELASDLFKFREIDKVVLTSTQQVVQADIIAHNIPGSWSYDGRFRLQSLLGYNQWGLSLGYSWGLSNMDGQNQPNKSYTRYAYVGIVYTLKHKR